MACPHCAATTTTKLPKRTHLGYHAFRCSTCRRQFNERTNSPFNYLEFPTDIGMRQLSVQKIRDDVWRPRHPSSGHRSGSHQLTHQDLKPSTRLPSLLS
jgi:hypothetical protein